MHPAVPYSGVFSSIPLYTVLDAGRTNLCTPVGTLVLSSVAVERFRLRESRDVAAIVLWGA